MTKTVCNILLLLAVPLFGACTEVAYCVQCAVGHFDVQSKTRPIADLLNDPAVPTAEKQKLERVVQIRDFAVAELDLPDNDSYRLYADIGRPYVVWNVVATPEFSLAPKQWCYPVVGCVAYRGYFSEEKARLMAKELAEQGYDVDVYGVKAYSTLKWFNDPVLNTFLDGDDSQLAGLIFHELAHQVAYTKDDCSFNEAFARTVETEGLRRWLEKSSTKEEWTAYLERQRIGDQFLVTLQQTREQLSELYNRSPPDEEKRSGKQRILADLTDQLREQRHLWPNPAALDNWLARGLNNARLAGIATYHEQVPAFQGLLTAVDNSLPAFYTEVRRLARLPAAERTTQLAEHGTLIEVACVDPEPE
ncbi:MAG: aminopeptidase [Desulfuromonadales bacterium]|nr:aminopeptidase [Desulfuromonadales bacterium]